MAESSTLPVQILTPDQIGARMVDCTREGWVITDPALRDHAIWTLRVDHACEVAGCWPDLAPLRIAA